MYACVHLQTVITEYVGEASNECRFSRKWACYSLFYAQCRPRGAIWQNISSKVDLERDYCISEFIHGKTRMVQNCLCDAGTAISFKIVLPISPCYLLKKLFNWVVLFLWFWWAQLGKLHPDFFFSSSKKYLLGEVSNIYFLG